MKKILIALILLFSAFLYFYKLESIPSGFYVDEATVAYNARSIAETEKDEYGFAHPIYFRLLGSYSPSLFIYLSSVLIKFVSSSPIVFRSISAVAVVISVLVLYLLSRRLKLYKFEISYFAITLFYSISPWIIFNARLGYETTLGFLFFNIAAYLLFVALKNPKFLVAGVLLMSLSTYISHNQRFLAPIFLVTYLIVFWKLIFKRQNRKILIFSFLTGLITQIPNLSLITTRAFWIKNNQFGFNYVWNYLMYLSPKTLFWQNPDIDLQRTLPKISILYDWMVIPYLVGGYLLIRRVKEFNFKFIAVYGLITLSPAVFSGYFLSSQRMLVFAVPLLLIIGIGIDELIKYSKKWVAILILIGILAYSLITLYSSYFVLFPKERANAWNYGYDQVAEYIKKRPEKKFLIDDTRNPRTYILLLYFLEVPPEKYQAGLDPYFRNNYYSAPPMATTFKFENVEVRQIDWRKDPQKDLIIIGDSLAISEGQMKEHRLTEISQFKDPLGNIIFKIYKTQSGSL